MHKFFNHKYYSDTPVIERTSTTARPETDRPSLLLRAVYTPVLHLLLAPFLFKKSWATRLLGWICDRRISRLYIGRAVTRFNVNPNEADSPLNQYRTFNEFFSRRLTPGARPYDTTPGVLVSPVDCRLSAYQQVDPREGFQIKGKRVNIGELSGSEELAAEYANGVIVLARLAFSDYHRFHFPFAGEKTDSWSLSGGYESVHPCAYHQTRPILHNVRKVTILNSSTFGKTAYIEVGAFAVSSIVQTHTGPTFDKMDEKGYFKIGASAILLLLRSDQLHIDQDLIKNTEAGYETRIRAGERLGFSIHS